MSQNLSDVVGRLDRLERQNRLLRHGLLLVLLLFGGVFVMGQAPPFGKTLEGNEVLLRDNNGTTVLKLRATKHGPAISLHDEDGNARALLAASGRGASFFIYDEEGNPRIVLGAGSFEPVIKILDKDGEAVFSKP